MILSTFRILRIFRFLRKDLEFRIIIKCLGIALLDSNLLALILISSFISSILALLGNSLFNSSDGSLDFGSFKESFITLI